ncbi:MAG: hypothetical protein IKJ25_04595 [Clostridia bacterium]|nr:hypothetical protein [Clostridia bacterium]
MDKKQFVKEYNIKDAVPLDPSLRVLPAEGFAQAVEKFINERFRGVARARAQVASYAGVLVSAEYTAYFFKTLLTEIYGRAFLEINISNDNEKLIIEIEYGEELPLAEKQVRNLIRTARNAGMTINLLEGTIRLSLCFSEAAIRRVYAISVNDGRRIMLSKFGELFYCGEDYPTEEMPRRVPTLTPKKQREKERRNNK